MKEGDFEFLGPLSWSSHAKKIVMHRQSAETTANAVSLATNKFYKLNMTSKKIKLQFLQAPASARIHAKLGS